MKKCVCSEHLTHVLLRRGVKTQSPLQTEGHDRYWFMCDILVDATIICQTMKRQERSNIVDKRWKNKNKSASDTISKISELFF